MKDIDKTIEAQLKANAKGLDWAHVYLRKGQLEDTRERLIRNRILLKRVARANGVKAAAAVFGESQVGKSYMVDCLLTSEKSVLNVYDARGEATGFLEYINPLGQGKEATSLISRFTTDKVWKNDDFPVRVELLSPIDVVMVIVDTYFNDVQNHTLPKSDSIIAEIERLKNKYGNRQKCQEVITEDEIYELKEYFGMNMLQRGEAFREALKDNRYFETLSAIISGVDPSEWSEVFSYLWNAQPKLTEVFNIIMACLKSLEFSKTVYIKMDAVLRAPGTILHVDRIYELFGLSTVKDDKGNKRTIVSAKVPDMIVLTENGREVSGVKKSEFCALAMEVAFTISGGSDAKAALVAEKPFLEYLDILDFPGSRSRKMIEADFITELDACEMMLRGKVAYLFNKYSQQFLISNLLFCHHSEKSEVTTLPSLLKGWVETTVGKTPQERASFLQNAEVAPLFIIGTKFNMDLKMTPDDSKGDEASKLDAKKYRWTKRFGNLENLLNKSAADNWFLSWTPGETFRNTYLLRSYEYSCQDGLYYGYQTKDPVTGLWSLVYDKEGRLQGELGITEEYVKFFDELKETFKDADFVRNHFADPEVSWREVIGYGERASDGSTRWVPRDGSVYIIRNLTRSSRSMNTVRNIQFSRILGETFECLVKVLHDFYHDDNADAELRRQLNIAGSINLAFDALFGKDKYFFSDFISALTVEEETLHDVVLDTINDMRLVEETDLSMLFAIRAKAEVDPGLSFEENKALLREAYNCATDAELESRLEPFGITVEDIINPPKVMNFSMLIADAVEKTWIGSHLAVDHYGDFVKRGLNQMLLQSLFSNLEVLYKEKVRMSDRIARRIHPYVSSAAGSLDSMSDMLADICSEMINTFVNSVGSAYYDDEMWSDIDSTVNHNNFVVEVDRNEWSSIRVETDKVRSVLPEVFDSFDNVDKILNQIPVDFSRLEHFSNYEEYRKWIERMKISFLATNGIPKYDVDMNNALRNVLVDNIVRQDALSELVESNALLSSLSTIR